MTQAKTTINEQEVANFNDLADEWWDENGPMKPLHDMNPVRMLHFKQQICEHFERNTTSPNAFDGLEILDIGCGAGLVCEPLSRLGANVTGIDAAYNNIEMAKAHAAGSQLDIDYHNITAEEASRDHKKYDVVLALEIIEHVEDPEFFVKSVLGCVKENGIAIFSTLNRTAKSYLFAIIGAEYIMRILPRGTHDWKKFIKPSELVSMVEKEKALITDITGMTYHPVSKEFSLSDRDLSVNYFITATQ